MIFVPTNKTDDYISIRDAAAQGIASRSTIDRWIKSGSIRSFTSGRLRMVSRADLDACVAAREPVVNEAELVELLAKRIASAAPVLSPEGRAKLAELLR